MSETPKKVESNFILWKIVALLEKFFCIVPVAVMTVLVFAAVICRYVLKSPLGWSEEVTLICMTWCIFGAASYAFYTGLNVGVTFLVDRIKGKGAHIVAIIINIICIAFFCVLLYTSFLTFENSIGKFSLAAHIPEPIPMAAMPVGCVMIILRLIQMITERLAAMRNDA